MCASASGGVGKHVLQIASLSVDHIMLILLMNLFA